MYNLKFDFNKLNILEEKFKKLDEEYRKAIVRAMNKIGEYAIGVAKENTAVGVYNSYILNGELIKDGKVGGQLRNAWNRSKVEEKKEKFELEVFNPIEYAQYYEYGHRQKVGMFVPRLGKRLKSPFVEGRFPLKKSIDKANSKIKSIIELEINKVGI